MPKAGIKGQTYYNSGTRTTPVWNRARLLRDFTLPISTNEIPVKNKGSQWIKYLRGLLDVAIDAEADWEPGNPLFEALKTSFFTESIVEIAILDGGIKQAGAQGVRAGFIVTKFERGEPLEDVMTLNFSLRLAAEHTHEPEWVTAGTNGTLTVVAAFQENPANNP